MASHVPAAYFWKLCMTLSFHESFKLRPAWKAWRHRIIREVMDLIFTCCICWLASFICWICRFSFKYKPWSCSQQIVELFFWNCLCRLTFFMRLVTKFIVKEKDLMVFGTSSWENITETAAWSYKGLYLKD